MDVPERVVVVGAGLIGTSIGLALRAHGTDVVLHDTSDARARHAAALGAGRVADSAGAGRGAEIAVISVPPAAVAPTLRRLQDLDVATTYSDTASIKSQPQAEAEALACDTAMFVGGHPVAGRERSGPAAARADLFLGRPWVLTPSSATTTDTLGSARRLVAACGAVPVVLGPGEHDAVMALVSHAPQALASLLAARLTTAAADAVALAGQGFRDLTRIADSDPGLWAQIAAGNGDSLGAVLRELAADLTRVADRLEAGGAAAGEAFGELVAAGNAGRARLPGKHGATATPFAVVPVVIADEPGTLARLLADAGAAGVNVEDLVLEHSPGAPVGTCELAVRREQVDDLTRTLADRGWAVHAPR